MKEIHVAYCADNGYAPYLGVSLASILLNAGIDEKLHIYIVTSGITAENREKIASLKRIKDFSLCFFEPNLELLEGFRLKKGCAAEMFYRLLLPEILSTLDTVIYLDCDVIVRRSLAELLAYDVSNACLAAVPDLIDYLPFSSCTHKRRLHGDTDFSYFNSGVMLLNLERMQREDLFRRCMSWLEKNADRARYCDQDGLNACLLGDFVRLHPKWNVQTPMYWPGVIRNLKKRTDTRSALSDPAIVHFTTGEKPGGAYSLCPWGDLFERYLLHTPWKDSPVFNNPVPNGVVMSARRLLRWIKLRLLWIGGIVFSWCCRKRN
ncbi:MAG TPA: glycosyltransferase family 8 protein [Syntrophales bacterium]|nr:glycosyltransferase family 8 protein [Syntrophales bacterium]HPQ43697.1 glycosyltransferase family 8 protein [Syntrophales bacterium]